jgi:hypothetical protein
METFILFVVKSQLKKKKNLDDLIRKKGIHWLCVGLGHGLLLIGLGEDGQTHESLVVEGRKLTVRFDKSAEDLWRLLSFALKMILPFFFAPNVVEHRREVVRYRLQLDGFLVGDVDLSQYFAQFFKLHVSSALFDCNENRTMVQLL